MRNYSQSENPAIKNAPGPNLVSLNPLSKKVEIQSRLTRW